MATTFERCFPHLPYELQAEVFGHALEEEDKSRILVVWLNRLMPFKGLVSPLLSVNKLSRKTAKARFNIKLNIFALNTDGLEFSLDDYSPDDYLFVLNELTQDYNRIVGNQRLPLNQLEPRGILYLNPAQNIVLHGYNCIPDFFRGMRQYMSQEHGGQVGSPRTLPSPVLRHCSGTLPDAFFTSLEKDPRKSKCFHINDDELDIEPEEEEHNAWESWNRLNFLLGAHQSFIRHAAKKPVTAFQTLRLTKKESNTLMEYISTSPDSLPGYVESWVESRIGILEQLPESDAGNGIPTHGGLVGTLDCVNMEIGWEEKRYKRVQLAAAQKQAGEAGGDHGEKETSNQESTKGLHELSANPQLAVDVPLAENGGGHKYINPHDTDDLSLISKRLDCLKQAQAYMEAMEQNVVQLKTKREGERLRLE